MATAVLSRAIMYEQKIPNEVNVRCVDRIVALFNGKPVNRTAEIRVNLDGSHEIRVVLVGRTREEILNSIFHELTHLIRVVNGSFNQEPNAEEIENLLDMKSTYPLIGWVASILMLEQTGDLPSLENYGKEESNSGAGAVVCEGNIGAGAGLPVYGTAPQSGEVLAQPAGG